METALALWGRKRVGLALSYPDPDPITEELVAEVLGRSDPARGGELLEWVEGLPWPTFCAVVAVVSRGGA